MCVLVIENHCLTLNTNTTKLHVIYTHAYPHPFLLLVQVPDYHEVIKDPMDFSTMQKKVDQHQYLTLDDFEGDFDRVWRNAMTYNDPSTVYYRAAVRMKLEGAKALKQVRACVWAAKPNPGVKGCVKRRRVVPCVPASTFLCLYSSFELVVLLCTVRMFSCAIPPGYWHERS